MIGKDTASAAAKVDDLARARLRAASLPAGAVWRSLDELSRTPEFCEAVDREFPSSVMDFEDGFSRRNFLRLMGASMALAGIYGCSERPSERILPYVNPPEQVVPGMPMVFATTMPLHGYGYGVLATSYEGRPTKIEGNPDHPATLGATSIFHQASILQLYDPERARTVTHLGEISSWQNFRDAVMNRVLQKRKVGGKGVRLLTETITSPTLISQINQFLRQFPDARWHHYDPLARVNAQEGSRIAFGRPVETIYRFRRSDSERKPIDAKVIVSLDNDFLWEEPGSLQYSRHFIAARQVRVRHWWQTTMNRLYMIESQFSLTGSMADHRLPLKPSDIPAFAGALAGRLGVSGASMQKAPAEWSPLLDAIAADLKKPENHGATLILAGESQLPEIHALAHAMNDALGNNGNTVYHIDPVIKLPPQSNGNVFDSLRELTNDIKSGQVDTLLIMGGNPAYTAPADINFADALLSISARQDAFTVSMGHHGTREDNTAFRTQWHLPKAHYLESWGDARAFDGTTSIIQPLIAPLHQGRSEIEVMDILLTPPNAYPSRTGYEIVRAYWQEHKHGDFDANWNQWLQKGLIADLNAQPVQVTANGAPSPRTVPSTRVTSSANDLEIVFRRDPSVGDGSFSNVGWLQECPKFFTKLVWDNAALVSPVTARKRGLSSARGDGQIFRFTTPQGFSIEAPVMVLSGIPEDVILMHFGYGMEHGGSSALEPDGRPRGFNAYALRHSQSPWSATGVAHEATDRFHKLVTTHNHYAMDTLPRLGQGARDVREDLRPHVIANPGMDDDQRELQNRTLIRTTTLSYFNEDQSHREFVKDLGPRFERERKPLLSLYPGWDYSKGYQWGMSIDLQSCIGCNACLVACVAENNIAVVGRDEVDREREMHWIRIDQYFGSSLSDQETVEIREGKRDPDAVFANPRVYHQPVPCMHCENAPCELVCPVGATVHSPEGINDMVYNRCVGTRYCSNNCPYKVRRFNFFNWFKGSSEWFDLQHNPDVTVRSRGVMEKCTYCVQRTSNTRIEIEKMIVRIEERQRFLSSERQSASPDRARQIDHDLEQLERDRHNEELRKLEQLQVACQQSCPTGAIQFGHLLPVQVLNEIGQREDRLTFVAKLKQEPLDYAILAELTTKPRTTYMGRLRNPNPDLEPEARA